MVIIILLHCLNIQSLDCDAQISVVFLTSLNYVYFVVRPFHFNYFPYVVDSQGAAKQISSLE